MLEIRLDQVFSEDGNFKFSDVTDPFWYTTFLWDIPNTMIGMINSMPPNCKKLTMVKSHSLTELARIQAAADAKGIEINWIPMPPLEVGE